MKYPIIVLIVFMLAVSACSNAPTGTPTSSVPPITLPSLGNIVYSDIFSDPGSGWVRGSLKEATAEYLDGEYHLSISTPNTDLWAVPAELSLPASISVSVKVTKTAGPGGSTFGIICCYENSENFYYLYINGDGHAGIDIEQDGFRSNIESTNVMPAVNTGDAINHLRADCVYDKKTGQNTLILAANGVPLLSTTNSVLKGGSAGLMAISLGAEGIDVRFDDFQVYEVVQP